MQNLQSLQTLQTLSSLGSIFGYPGSGLQSSLLGSGLGGLSSQGQSSGSTLNLTEILRSQQQSSNRHGEHEKRGKDGDNK
jgi:hypothetical protein